MELCFYFCELKGFKYYIKTWWLHVYEVSSDISLAPHDDKTQGPPKGHRPVSFCVKLQVPTAVGLTDPAYYLSSTPCCPQAPR